MTETSLSGLKKFTHSSFSSLVHSLFPKDNIFKNISVKLISYQPGRHLEYIKF